MCAAPTLTLTIRGPSATSRIVADGPSVTIGRGADCTVVLADTRRAISRLQARIEWRGGHYVLTDSGSNSTLVNGHILTVSHQAVLRDADALSIGEYLIELGIDGPPASDDATVLAHLPGLYRATRAGDEPVAATRHRGDDGRWAGQRCNAAAGPSHKALANPTIVRSPPCIRDALPESGTAAADAEPNRNAHLSGSERGPSPAREVTATWAATRDATVKRPTAPSGTGSLVTGSVTNRC